MWIQSEFNLASEFVEQMKNILLGIIGVWQELLLHVQDKYFGMFAFFCGVFCIILLVYVVCRVIRYLAFKRE